MNEVHVLLLVNGFVGDEVLGVYKKKENALKRMEELKESTKIPDFHYAYRVETHTFRD
ncbi:hypothetical protein [Bacillus anthracis]|uniref:hypothetical protein n=1 Tax=Bacillus anthracis TaxID=1392 RepID=UPI002DBDB0C3|nr:hypothetical protein [Bacillus anthracis]MEB9454418.1 hypothetical protein [Bacillus anthracis]UBR30224.1 hypothetical protein LCG60_27140 [Bacillus sp. SD-4]